MICFSFKRGRIWQAKVQLDTWLIHRTFSLGTTDKRVAADKLAKRMQEFEKEAGGYLPPQTVREARERALESLCEAFLSRMTERQRSSGTIRKYTVALKVIRTACGWTKLRDVTEKSFLDYRADTTLRAKTSNDYLAVWYGFFRWLKRQRLVLENPFEYIDRMDTKQSDREYRRALTEAEVLQLLATAPVKRRLVYRLILEAGLRRCELQKLRWGDFTLPAPATGMAGVPPLQGGKGRVEVCPPQALLSSVRVPASIAKNGKTTVLPLGAEVVAELVAFRPPDAAAFQRPFASVPRCGTIRRDLARAGITFVDTLGRRMDLHAMRKTMGTHLVLSGAQPRVVMEAMRHSDLKLTMRTYMDAQQLQGPVAAAVERLPWHRPTTVVVA